MTPVDQRVIDPIRGDCMRACLASLLNLDYELVPNLAAIEADGGRWFKVMTDFLFAHRYRFVGTYSNMGQELKLADYMEVYRRSPGVGGLYMAGGPSKRVWEGGVTCTHAVIIDQVGHLIHDPHPSRAGVKFIDHVSMIQRSQP